MFKEFYERFYELNLPQRQKMLKVIRQQINLSHSSTEEVDRSCLNSGHFLLKAAKGIPKDKAAF